MRALIQRVKYSNVKVNEEIIGSIKKGIVLFLGIKDSDGKKEIDWILNKIIGLRIFEDEEGKMNNSLEDIGGELLIISQFTLYGDCSKGKRPGFSNAAKPELAKEIYENFINEAKKTNLKIQTGIFGADMKVEILNDGPVTFMIEKEF